MSTSTSARETAAYLQQEASTLEQLAERLRSKNIITQPQKKELLGLVRRIHRKAILLEVPV